MIPKGEQGGVDRPGGGQAGGHAQGHPGVFGEVPHEPPRVVPIYQADYADRVTGYPYEVVEELEPHRSRYPVQGLSVRRQNTYGQRRHQQNNRNDP